MNENNKLDKTLAWFREEKNLSNLRTGSTVLFIIIFVFYYYGFRTGFDLFAINVFDVLVDIAIVVVSAFLVINDFSMRGVESELRINEKDFTELKKEHKELVDKVSKNETKAEGNLIAWNKKEYERQVARKKEEMIKDLEYKRRKYVGDTTKKGIAKTKQLDKEIKRISNAKYKIKMKFKSTTLNDLYKSGAIKEKKDVIGVTYSPHKDTVSSQSGIVTVTVVFTSMLRFAIDPTIESLLQGIFFLSFLFPFLLIRAITSYQISRYNTANKYPQAVRKQISILKYISE